MSIDWKNIQTVLLDMDGTLLDLHYDNYFWRQYVPQVYAASKGVSHEEAMTLLESLFTQHAGTLQWYCVNFWSDELDLDIMQHKRDVAHKIAFRPAAREFLQTCRDQTNDVRLITNAHRKVLDLKIEHTQIDRYFDQTYCSHELDFPKEQVEFWHRLRAVGDFNPETTLFVDDSESVLESAHDYGIKHLYSIAKPDSTKEREAPSRFTMIGSFV